MFSLSKCFLWQIIVKAQVWKGNINFHLFSKVVLLETEGKVCTALRVSCNRSIYLHIVFGYQQRQAALATSARCSMTPALGSSPSCVTPSWSLYSRLWKDYCKTTVGAETIWVQDAALFGTISYKIMTVVKLFDGIHALFYDTVENSVNILINDKVLSI